MKLQVLWVAAPAAAAAKVANINKAIASSGDGLTLTHC